MVDYRKYLTREEPEPVLYVGGTVVYAEGGPRRLAAPVELAHGTYLARRIGRNVELGEPTESLAWNREPNGIGHYASGWIAHEPRRGSRFSRLELCGAAEPEPLARVRVIHHHAGVTLLSEILFDDEAEVLARARCLADESLGELRGVGLTLRLAFGLELATRVGRSRASVVSPLEIEGSLGLIAAEGVAGARPVLEAIEARRSGGARPVREEPAPEVVDVAPLSPSSDAAPTDTSRPRRGRGRWSTRPTTLLSGDKRDVHAYCNAALQAAGASFVHLRDLGSDLEVHFRYLGEVFVSVVERDTMNVRDAGICLDGEDSLLTLESLPSAIREAHSSGRLVLTRRTR
jgi:hypothetical protein